MKTLIELLSAHATASACALIAAGALLVWRSSKQRNEAGEWGSALQWGYLLAMVGGFGLMAFGLEWSFTAVLLAFTVFTGAVWAWAKTARRKLPENGEWLDGNHFRDYMAGFFPIIAVVFVLRTFVAEPFQIPSSSMRPGLVKGDFILVNKFAYGIRVPVLNSVLIPTGTVQRGDVAVFNYPVEPKVNYIKRIVGVPGDVVEYRDKVLTVNGKAEHDTPAGSYAYRDDNLPEVENEAERFRAGFDGREFDVLKKASANPVDPATFNHYVQDMREKGFESGLQQHCEYAEDGSAFRCTVPAGKYFAMGDNRDSSADSRYWGFVDDRLMVGRAFAIWLNIGDMKRIGSVIR
ncbi:signal peptidase I [Conchiformibius kuhniae]|uniref:Signal peptidase I n=1 Tax=Conchiformibius kuhniae TaxID=211502 RepID=A0ABD8B877_9NEIS